MPLRDIKEVISLAHTAKTETIFGLNLYAKLMDLKKQGLIYGENICDELYYACVYDSRDLNILAMIGQDAENQAQATQIKSNQNVTVEEIENTEKYAK